MVDKIPNANSAKIEKPMSRDTSIPSDCKKIVQSLRELLYSCSRPYTLGLSRTFCELHRDCLLPTCCDCFLSSAYRSRNLLGSGCPCLRSLTQCLSEDTNIAPPRSEDVISSLEIITQQAEGDQIKVLPPLLSSPFNVMISIL